MSLFQQSVLTNYLELQDKELTEKLYKKFIKYFHNPTIQQNIRDSKEEQYQSGFLTALFVDVFGYTLNPMPNFELTTEFKNEKGAKKADGAILKNEQAIAVIELKGTKTKDLEKIRQQAFDYKANHSACVYVITSNFEKLRFYIDNAVEHIEFDLFTLTLQEFRLLNLCVSQQNILNDLPKTIQNESLRQEKDITNKLYSDYSVFKRELFRQLVKSNINNEVFRTVLTNQDDEQAKKNIKLTLFKKSQKFIDRLLFIFFAEDRKLLAANSTLKILQDWNSLKELDAVIPLYDRFKQYFNYLDTGRVGTEKFAEIYAYNGGLFKPDAILDSLIIDDDMLYKHTYKLSEYDFASQVDVNILGHIFENSLNEIESVNAEIEGVSFDKQKSKRKKDGVFYTPKYITKYIVDNTVGKLCNEKQIEYGIVEEEYLKGKKGRPKAKIETLFNNVENYRKWLLTITICDPACGSGAFLNQALDFLINEHNYLDGLLSSLTGTPLVLSNIETTILENNIFGVDLNEESVEIAKLSLWLRTARPRRKLNDLSSNIKCGNSLIDDLKIAGSKAFNWEVEFKNVFKAGGFDVVIGNPPYVNLYNMNKTDRDYFESSSNYQSTHLKYDLYVLFIEKGINLLKQKGIISFIIPSVILSVPYGKLIREKIIKSYQIDRIVDFTGFKVFSDAMVESCIISISNIEESNDKILVQKPFKEILDFEQNSLYINQSTFLNTDGYQFRLDLDLGSIKIINKIKKNSVPLGSIYYVSKGIVAYSKIDDRKKDDFIFSSELSENHKKYLEGRDVNRYVIDFDNKFLEYDIEIMSRPTFPELHTNNKILVRAISGGLNATYDEKGFYIDQKLIICSNRKVISSYLKESKKPKLDISKEINLIDDYSVLGVLNSKTSSFYYSKMLKGGVSILPEDIRQFPICTSFTENIKLKDKVIFHLSNHKKLKDQNNKFQNYLQSQFPIEKLTKKLQNWDTLDFVEFIRELNKAIKKAGGIKLSKLDEMDWMEVFETKKAEAQKLNIEIVKTDADIDAMVYDLYELTKDEIAIIEQVSA